MNERDEGYHPPVPYDRSLLIDPLFFELLMAKIDERALTRVETKLHDFKKTAIALAAIIVVLLSAGGFWLIRATVRDLVEPDVSEAVSKVEEFEDIADKMDGVAEEMRSLADVVALYLAAEATNTDYSLSQANSLIYDIGSLYAKYREDEQFTHLLHYVVEKSAIEFYAKGHVTLLNDLHQAAPELAESSRDFLRAIVEILGNALLDDPRAPFIWKNGMNEVYREYQYFAAIASDSGLKELKIIYDILMAFVRCEHDVITHHYRDATGMQEHIRVRFVDHMRRLSGHERRRISEITIAFLCEHSAKELENNLFGSIDVNCRIGQHNDSAAIRRCNV